MNKLRTISIISCLLLPLSAAAAGEKSLQRQAQDLVIRAIQVEMTPPPKDQEVCFSPDEACDIKLYKFMKSAEKSIDVAIYDINLTEIVDILVEKSKTIPVRIVVDRRQAKTKRSIVPVMIREGLDVRYGRQRGIQHDKFTIVDGKMIQTGSFNYTRGASERNNENQFYNANPQVVSHYQAQFEKMWAKGAPAKKSEKTQQ